MHQAARTFVYAFNPASRRRELVEVSPELAAAYREKPPRMLERSLRDPRSVERLTERVVVNGTVKALTEYWGGAPEPPEGPWFGFRLFLGESPTWNGPDSQWVWRWKVRPDIGLKEAKRKDEKDPNEVPRWWVREFATNTTLSGAALEWKDLHDFLIWVLGQTCADLGGLKELACRYCGHLRELGPETCCLGCDRTGQDKRVPAPTEADLARRPPEPRRSYVPGPLPGGRK